MADSDKLIPWLGDNERKDSVTVAVIGDVILDEYLNGHVNRISPEAPVPVHLVSSSKEVPGGAANTARNIKLVGGEVNLLSVCGDDEAGKKLKKILNAEKIDTSNILISGDRPTVRKTRLTTNSQQLVRIDRERTHPIAKSEQDKMLSTLEELKADAILISDYGKGVLPEEITRRAIAVGKKRKIPVIVDPKGTDFTRYSGAFLITPNYNEACGALGLDSTLDWEGEDLGVRLQKKYGLKNLLITMGAKGMIFVAEGEVEGKKSKHLPAEAKEVYDVSGAGDTVVAIIALSFAAGANVHDAMRLATTSAAIVVEKWGTQPVKLEELKRALVKTNAHGFTSTSEKITTREALAQKLQEPEYRDRTVVFTNGCFDILHAGHVSYLETARGLGDILIIGVNSDNSIRRLKGKTRPIIEEKQRMELLSALAAVTYVVPFDEDTPLELITALTPNVLVKGADWDKKEIVGGDVVEKAGGTVETISFLPGISTSEIIKRIKN